MSFRTLLTVVTAAFALALPATAGASADWGTRYYGWASGISDNEAIMLSVDALKREHLYIIGSYAPKVGERFGSNTVWTLWRAQFPGGQGLPQCMKVQWHPYSWSTNNSTSVTVEGKAYTGTPCYKLSY